MLRRGGGHLVVKEEGTVLTNNAETIDVVGNGVTATASGDHVTLTVAGSSLTTKNEGSTLTTATTSIDFVGATVNATESSGAVTVTVSNVGVDTLAAVGSSPNDNGASISGTTLTLQPADATHPGVVSEGAQTLGSGTKTVDALTLGVTAPSAPAAGVTMSSRATAGSTALVTPSAGAAYSLQPSLLRPTRLIRPVGNGTSTINTVGFPAVTDLGDPQVGASFATTNIRTQAMRRTFPSAASAGSTGGWRNTSPVHWRGDAAGLGGFRVAVRFGFANIPATRRWFVGLFPAPAIGPGNVDPSSITDFIAVAQDTADTEIQFMHNDSSGSATKSSSGLTSPTTSDLFEVVLYAPPNASAVVMSVEQLNSSGPVSYTASSNLPSNTTSLYIWGWVNNESTAAIMSIDLAGVLSETDY